MKLDALGGCVTQEEEDAYDTCRREIYARISSQHDQEPELGPGTTADASATKKVSQLPVPTPQATKDTSRRTRSGRIMKNAVQDKSVVSQGARSSAYGCQSPNT